jgi:hypothetical protein
MPSLQLHDVFDEIKQIHHQAAACCTEGAHSSDPRLNLLADFFRQWEQRLESYVGLVEGEQKGILGTWVQFAPTKGIDDALASLRGTECHELGVFVKQCFELQDEIVTVLRELANNLDAPKVRELLLDVAEFEQQAARKLGAAELTEYDA